MINEFLQYLQYEKNYSPHTVLSYHIDIEQFCRFIDITPCNFDPSKVESHQIQQWILSLLDEGKTSRSISRKISTLKSFWHYLLKQGLIQKNPVLKVLLPKTNKTLPAFFRNSEMEVALDSTFLADNFKAVRDHLIIKCFYLTGIRLAELISIEDKDVDLYSGQIRVVGKRNKERIVPISKELCKEIKTYINIRNKEIVALVPNLFIRDNGNKLYPKLVYNLVHNTMTCFSSLHKRSPHVLRHSFATSLLNGGADINAVKELLGHSSLAATQVYTHTSFDELYNIYEQAHPRANKKGGNYEIKNSIHQF